MNQTYIVIRGDTLYGISNQFGVSVDDIKRINNLANNSIVVGQSIMIPNVQGTNPNNLVNYTVKKGDSLYSIARVYNTTVSELMKLNNLKSQLLSIGQKLVIPETYSEDSSEFLPIYINYTVKRGDTLYSIAKKYNIDVNTIIKDNALKNNSLSIGQNLKIRTTDSGVVEECFGEAYVPSTTTNYTVVKGDSLYAIAKKYNTTVDNIKKKNNLTSNQLYIGQVLKI